MLSTIVAAALAASPSPSPSPSPSAPPQIARVVTSDRGWEAAARTARTTYVVTAAQMARDGDRTVADAIENVPGVNVLRYGAFGAAATAGIRGSSSQQVLVLMDGLPVAGSEIDDVNLELLSTAGIDRIEIVEGGGSTLYGSGAMGGVINIVTVPSENRSAASASAGSFDQQSYLLQTPYLSFARTYAANGYPVENAPNRQNAQAALTAVTARYAHAIGGVDITLTGNLENQNSGAPGELGFVSPTSEQGNVNRNVRLSLERNGSHSATTLQLGDSSIDLSYTCDTPVDSNCPNSAFPTPAPGMRSNPPYAQMLYDRHWMASLRNVAGTAKRRIVYGVDLVRGVARIDPGTGGGSPLAADDAPVFDEYAQTAAYVQSQWFGERGGLFYAGLRGERDGGLGGAYSPSLGGIVPLGGVLALKLNAATAFRAPTAEELYYPGFSNPNLAPERTRVADATLAAPALWGGVSLGWFTMSGENLIVSPPPAYIPENVGHAAIEGVALLATTPRSHGYAATLAVTNLYRAQDLQTGARLPGRGPVMALSVGLSYAARNSRFDEVQIVARTQGPQEGLDPYLSPAYAVYEPASFTTVDADLGYRLSPRLVLSLRGYNLGNARYALYAGYPMPGRSLSIELRSR